MQDSAEHSQPVERRQQNADLLKSIYEMQVENRDRLISIESTHKSMSKAFVLNDLGEPDYDGHRSAHARLIKESAVVDGYKQDATKKIIGAIVMFVLGLLATGFVGTLHK